MIASTRIQFLQIRIACYDDQQAYKELYTGLYAYLYHFAFSFVRSKQLSEEIISDVFIRIWEKRKEIDQISNLKVYLYVATRNTALNYIERQKRIVTESIDEVSGSIKGVYFDPEQLMITAEMMNRIQKAIEALPPKCQLVFKMVKDDGLKYREVAEIMGISIKTVENQLAIALQKIGDAVDFHFHRSIPAHMGNSR
jgi:RNA polymerase sigma-70 factor (ECF subfamily)